MTDMLQTKRIHFCLPAAGPGAGDITAVEIAPGTTAADVLAQFQLIGHCLSPVGSALHLEGEVPLWPHVQEGQKVMATPHADVGVSANVVRIIGSEKKAMVVPPRSVTLWKARNWRPHPSNSNLLIGNYKSRHFGEVPGYVKLRGGDAGRNLPSFYMVTPPAAVLTGPHARCFRKRDDNVYWVHFNDRAMSIDAGIVAIEKQLDSSAQGGQ